MADLRSPMFAGDETIAELSEPVVRTYHRDVPLTVRIAHDIKAEVLALLVEHGYGMEPDGETGFLVITNARAWCGAPIGAGGGGC